MQRGIEAPTRHDVSRRFPAPLTDVRFRLSDGYAADVVEVAGDFSAWAPIAMNRELDDGFILDLQLETGRQWRYRFLLDGQRWMNDPDAKEFVTGPNGSAVSILET